MTFNIRFQGLVCHVSQGGETAVFMAGPPTPRHELRLVAEDPSDVISSTFTADRVFVKGSELSFQIAGQRLVLTGVDHQLPSMSPEFQRSVPALSAMATCSVLRQEVVRRQVSADVVGFLDHPGGRLSVAAYYPFKAQIDDGREPAARCVASIVQLSLRPMASATEVEIAGPSGRILLKTNATIDIFNTNPTPSGGLTNMHFHHYNALFGPGCVLRTSPIETSEKCPEAGKNEKVNGAECSNSHIP